MGRLKRWQRWETPWKWLGGPLGKLFAAYSLWAARSGHEVVHGSGALYRGPAVYVSWHEHVFHLATFHGARRRWQLMSPAPYMEPIKIWTEKLGMRTARARPHERMRASFPTLIEALRRGESVAIWIDGPAGPAHQPREGCVEVARRAGVPIIPVGYRTACNARMFWRWDRALVPLPGERVDVLFGDVLFVQDDTPVEQVLRRIADALNGL